MPVVLALVVAGLVMSLVANGELSPRVAPSAPPPPPGVLIWSADTETGDISQWNRDQFGESVFNTGTGTVAASDEVSHSGRFALKLTISGASGQTQAARILRWHDTPEEGYYSVWLYFPRIYRPAYWWNVIQFKSVGAENVPIWVVNVGNRTDGSMYFYLWHALTNITYSEINHVAIPSGHWTHLTLYLRRATDHSGRITVWQDGTLLFDVDQVQTAVGPNTHFGVSNYTDDIAPPDPVIYADDAKIRSVQTMTPHDPLSMAANP